MRVFFAMVYYLKSKFVVTTWNPCIIETNNRKIINNTPLDRL